MLLQKKSPSYIDFKTINDIIRDRHSSKNLELYPSDIMRFKYASIISVDVERSFSRIKNSLRSNRRHLMFDNLITVIFFFFFNSIFSLHIWMFLAHIL
jgi:hypothetical protein